LWAIGRGRLLLGIEKLSLQGVYPRGPLPAFITENLQADLAGNAFHSGSFLAAFMAMTGAVATSLNGLPPAHGGRNLRRVPLAPDSASAKPERAVVDG